MEDVLDLHEQGHLWEEHMNSERKDGRATTFARWLRVYKRLIVADLLLCRGVLVGDLVPWPWLHVLLFAKTL